MTARVVPLSSGEAGDARMGGTPQERVAAVEELTLAAWKLAGRALPSYTRETIPVVVGTLMTNYSLERMLQEHGITLTRVAVGDPRQHPRQSLLPRHKPLPRTRAPES